MNRYTMGWTIFVTMLGMMCLSVGADMQRMESWDDVKTVGFIGNALVHLGTVIGAFIGGKIQPS